MRRLATSISTVLIAGSLLLSVASPASAAAPVRRDYRGETTQGERIVLRTAEYPNGRVRLRSFEISTVLTCDDGTTHPMGWGWFYGTDGPVLAGGTVVEVIERDLQLAIHINGEVRRRQGSGTLKVTLGALTDDEQPQLCTTGDLTWEVLREVGRPGD
jgi:hypothetical protein